MLWAEDSFLFFFFFPFPVLCPFPVVFVRMVYLVLILTTVQAAYSVSFLDFVIYQRTTTGLIYLQWSPTAIITSTCHQMSAKLMLTCPRLGYLFLTGVFAWSQMSLCSLWFLELAYLSLPWVFGGNRWSLCLATVCSGYRVHLSSIPGCVWGVKCFLFIVFLVARVEEVLTAAGPWQAACFLTLLRKVVSSRVEMLFC